MPFEEPRHIAEFFGGGQVQSYYEGRLFETILGEPTKVHIDAWFTEVEKIYRNWWRSKPVLLFIDASSHLTTPHFRQRMLQLNAVAMTLPIKTHKALLAQEEDRGNLQVFSTLTGSGTNHRLTVFSDRDAAIEWLEKGL